MPVGGPFAGESSSAEEYDRRTDNPYRLAEREPLSTFSIDVDTASYTNVRRFLMDGRLPPKDAVRVEELVNYFNYAYQQPQGEHPITLNAESATCPWNPRHTLVRIGLQGKGLSPEDTPPRNLVFLLDTSGSMNAPNRLPLLKESLRLLARQLNHRDRVSIVAYAGSAGLVLPPTPGSNFAAISDALDRLSAGGSTNGGQGIVLAYQLARAAFVEGGANRVILGTDGDFNVGVTGSELVRLIEEKRKTGVYLTVLGFGMGNLKDATMEKLAQHGNGQYAYIDDFAEARRLFVDQVASLVPIAKDVKVQVEFNPLHVQAYRLIGYENRLLNNEDFNDDKKDAGDMGAGHTVTVLYEIVPPGERLDRPRVDRLKYQEQPKQTPAADSRELLTVKVRYLPPAGTRGKLLSGTLLNAPRRIEDASENFRFAAAVAAFGMVLRDSPHKGSATLDDVARLARSASRHDPAGQRGEFIRLVQTARGLIGPNGER
jgi:Ca-activated chloride channel family protein